MFVGARAGVSAVLCLVFAALAAAAGPEAAPDVFDVAPVWSGHPVRFALLTCGPRQFVAFYDAERQMTVASRKTGEAGWHFVKLPTKVGWDSHNSIVMAADDEGLLHLSGNMHCAALIYFRTEKPYDIDTFKKIPSMVGSEEKSCTYPAFLRGAKNELIYTYRDGRSGNGSQILNVWDPKTHAWGRLLDQPLFSGEGRMNAYFRGPVRGPDGWFHVIWVWRNSGDCATNHDLSYARSRDLVRWETSAGKPLALPITLRTGEIVDPVPPKGGIINGGAALGFDSRGRPVISYHKYDEQGKTQVYNARLEDGLWKIYQASRWNYRWEFSGGGSIHVEVSVRPISVGPAGRLVQSYSNEKEGSGAWLLDEATLKPVGAAPPTKPSPRAALPQELRKAAGDTPGMQVNWAEDAGAGDEKGVTYRLRWETLGANRDRPREAAPPPTMLRLVRMKAE
jgi:hypothetical protein